MSRDTTAERGAERRTAAPEALDDAALVHASGGLLRGSSGGDRKGGRYLAMRLGIAPA